MSDFTVLVVVLIALALLFRVNFVYYVVYVTAGVYILVRLATPRLISRVRLGRVFNENAFLGESVAVKLTVTNGSWLPLPWLRVTESIPPALMTGRGADQVMAFRSKESKSITYHVKPMRRGYYRLGPLLISVGDLFGIQESREQLPENYLTVFPRIISLVQLGMPSRLPYGTITTRRRVFDDPARPIGIRDYRSGDPIKHINWKVSAHVDDLLVRTFEPIKSLESLLVLNLNPLDYSRQYWLDGPEWAIVVAASLAVHLANSRQVVGLATNGYDPLTYADDEQSLSFERDTGRLQTSQQDDILRDSGLLTEGSGEPRKLLEIPPKSGRVHLMKILETLARIEAHRGGVFSQWLPNVCNSLSWGTNIIAITPSGDEDTCRAMHQLVRAGYRPLLMLVDPFLDNHDIQSRARNLGFQAYLVGREIDFNKWRFARPHDRHII